MDSTHQAHQAHKEEVRRKRSQKLSKGRDGHHGHARQSSTSANTTKALPPTPVNQSPASPPPQRLPPITSPISPTSLYSERPPRTKHRTRDVEKGYTTQPEPSTSKYKRESNVRFVGPISEEVVETKAEREPEVEETAAAPAETSTRLSHEKTLVSHLSYDKDLEGLPSFTLSRPYPTPKVLSPEEAAFRRSMRKRRIRILTVSTVIISLLIIAIILLVRLVRPKITNSINNIGTSSLSDAQFQCLSSFRDDAPSNPTGYSCQTCLPTLQSVSQDFMTSADHASDADVIQAAKQFCGLKAIFDSATSDGNANLSNMGWLKDIKTCTWGGITCDGSGSVSSLSLQSPAVPQTLPSEISTLTSLSQLNITGDHNIPSGQLNSSLPNSLRTLQLFNTSMQGISDETLFQQNGVLANLTALIMDGNPSMGSTLPSSLLNVPLQTLVVRNQNLNMAVDPLFASSTFGNTLTTLDLSFNSLTGALPFIFLPHLTNLNLANNNFTTLSQTLTFPPLLQTLSLQNNPLLNGTISTALCTNSLLTSCSFQGTVFSTVTNITCGSCQFR